MFSQVGENRRTRRGVFDGIQQSLRLLSSDQLEALWSRFYGWLSVREIAAVVRRSQGAVKMLVSRASPT